MPALKLFPNVFKFLRQYPGIFYSLSLLVIIPAVLYYNTFFLANSFQEDLDESFRDQMISAGQLIEPFLAERISDQDFLSSYIQKISENNPNIENFRILVPTEDLTFNIVASKNTDEIGFNSRESLLAQAFSEQEGIIALRTNSGSERFWEIMRPIANTENGNKVGLLTMSLSMRDADKRVSETLFWAYIIVVAAIALSLFLIFHHTRLFEYVSLSRRLQEIDKMKDNFIRMATHELQSPIINIRGHLSVLLKELEGKLNPDQEELFSRANLSAQNLGDLISDILEVSRIEQNRLDMTPQKINPAEIIKETIVAITPQAEEKGLRLYWEAPAEEFFIRVNTNRLRQILTNLITNGIKYSKKGGVKVVAKVQTARGKYEIYVTDTGYGIAAQDQIRLFQKFSRIKTRDTSQVPGTGLGLWISREIARKMGGDIFLASMEGVGSNFTVVFPLEKS